MLSECTNAVALVIFCRQRISDEENCDIKCRMSRVSVVARNNHQQSIRWWWQWLHWCMVLHHITVLLWSMPCGLLEPLCSWH